MALLSSSNATTILLVIAVVGLGTLRWVHDANMRKKWDAEGATRSPIARVLAGVSLGVLIGASFLYGSTRIIGIGVGVVLAGVASLGRSVNSSNNR